MYTVKIKPLIISLLIPLLVGGISALVSMPQNIYGELVKPPLSPPSIVFPIVWTILFILMGISAYFVYIARVDQTKKRTALATWAVQLFLNFTWSILFFNLHLYLLSFIWIILLWIAILAMIIQFYKISPIAAYLQIPYLVWVTFAAYLNFGIFMLN